MSGTLIIIVIGALLYFIVTLGVAGSIDEEPLRSDIPPWWPIIFWPVALAIVIVKSIRLHHYTVSADLVSSRCIDGTKERGR